jgi:putative ABC transport system ATP-binding protein
MIQLHNVHKEYRMGHDIIYALNDVTLTIEETEFISIIGPSGSGKSTLMHIIGGLDRPTRGQVIIGGQEISSISDVQLSKYRNTQVGFVFQSFNLQPSMTVLENVALPLVFARLSRKERIRRAKEVLELVGLSDRIRHKPGELSGGQRQRVSIARALVTNPKLILADEPTGNLDSNTSEKIVDLLRTINEKQKATLVIVTHNADIARQAPRIIKIRDGRIEETKLT